MLTLQIDLTFLASIPLEAITKYFTYFIIFIDVLDTTAVVIASIAAHHFC